MFHQVKVDRQLRNRLGLVGIVLALAATQQLPTGQVLAQQGEYTPLRVDVQEGDAKYAALRRIKQSVVNGGGSLANNKADIDLWYGSFFNSFASVDQLGKLADKRLELAKDLKSAGKSPAVHDYLLDKTWYYMRVFASNKAANGKTFNFHPVTRFNAMLVISELNSAETGVGAKFPVPDSSRTFDFMLQELQNPEQIDAVKVAALLGVLRHAQLHWVKPTIPANSQRNAAKLMLAIVNEATPPANRSPAAHLWLRRRAVEALAALQTLGSRMEEATAAVEAIIANNDEDIMLRCTAANALRLYADRGGKGLKLGETAQKLGALAVAAARSELDWISEYKRIKATHEEPEGISIAAFAGSMAGSAASAAAADEAMNMMGVETVTENAADDQSTGWDGLMGPTNALGESVGGAGDPEVVLAQRRILTKLVSIQQGLQAIATAAEKAGGADKQKVAEISEQLDAILRSTIPPEDQANLDGLAKSFGKAVRAMDHMTRTVTAKADSAVPPPVQPSGDATASTGS